MKKPINMRKRGIAPYARLREIGEPQYDFVSALAGRKKVSPCHKADEVVVNGNRTAVCVGLPTNDASNSPTVQDAQVFVRLRFDSNIEHVRVKNLCVILCL